MNRICPLRIASLFALLGLLLFPPRAGAEETPNPAALAVLSDAFPSLSSGALAKAKLAELPEGVLLQAGVTEIKAAALDEAVAAAPENVREQLGKNRFFLLENIASERLLEQAAKQAGKLQDGADAQKAIQAFFAELVAKAEVSDEEAKDFHAKNKDMVGGMPYEQVASQIKPYLLQQKQQELVETFIRTLGERMEIRVSRAWTEEQARLAMDNPVDKARASGKASMVDFGAHGCGPCDMMTPILADMEKKYGGKANVLFVPVREEQILGARYGVRGIPVQIFFDGNGKEIFRHTGFLAQAECEKWLDKACGK